LPPSLLIASPRLPLSLIHHLPTSSPLCALICSRMRSDIANHLPSPQIRPWRHSGCGGGRRGRAHTRRQLAGPSPRMRPLPAPPTGGLLLRRCGGGLHGITTSFDGVTDFSADDTTTFLSTTCTTRMAGAATAGQAVLVGSGRPSSPRLACGGSGESATAVWWLRWSLVVALALAWALDYIFYFFIKMFAMHPRRRPTTKLVNDRLCWPCCQTLFFCRATVLRTTKGLYRAKRCRVAFVVCFSSCVSEKKAHGKGRVSYSLWSGEAIDNAIV
jgi:hypothetical protein